MALKILFPSKIELWFTKSMRRIGCSRQSCNCQVCFAYGSEQIKTSLFNEAHFRDCVSCIPEFDNKPVKLRFSCCSSYCHAIARIWGVFRIPIRCTCLFVSISSLIIVWRTSSSWRCLKSESHPRDQVTIYYTVLVNTFIFKFKNSVFCNNYSLDFI